jgi:hypothetical protein
MVCANQENGQMWKSSLDEFLRTYRLFIADRVSNEPGYIEMARFRRHVVLWARNNRIGVETKRATAALKRTPPAKRKITTKICRAVPLRAHSRTTAADLAGVFNSDPDCDTT